MSECRGFSRFVCYVTVIIFLLLAAVAVGNELWSAGRLGFALPLAMVLLLAAGLLLIRRYWLRLSEPLRRMAAPLSRFALPALLALCAAVRLAWVLSVQIEPESDYYTFYHAAELLSGSFDISGSGDYLPRYMALFPHIFGYASFLSLIFTVFGASPLAAALTNAALSTLSMGLIYYLALRLTGRGGAILAALIWTFFPSGIIYDMFVLSEPYYTALLLAAAAALTALHGRLAGCRRWAIAAGGLGAGLLLALANSARPVAVIVIIAAAIVFFIIEPLRGSALAGRKALLLGCVLLAFAAGGAANDALFTARVGEEPASAPGFSVLVGFNETTRGQWSAEDSALLTEYNDKPGLSAGEVQEAMLGEAFERIKSANLARLIPEKLLVLLGRDDAAVDYGRAALEHTQLLSALCDAYYLAVWVLAAIGALYLLLRRGQTLLYLFPLYTVGLSLAHLLVEVAPRYHYSILPALTITASQALIALTKREG